MNNLLNSDVTEADVIQALQSRPALLPILGSSDWARVAQNPVVQTLITPLIAQAKLEKDEPLPILTDELYADFQKTGRRLPFEALYFERRRRLARAALCVLLDTEEHRAEWISSFLAKFYDVFSEESWALPAHVGEATGKSPKALDLFSAETANLMGEMITVFGSILPTEWIAQTKTRLHRDFFKNYLDNHARIGWTTVTNNWNAVCHQGILGAALAVEDDVHLVAQLLLAAKPGLQMFLSGFDPDGGCSEGPGYWSYGFGWFVALNEQLETATRGELSLVSHDAHIAEISRFGARTMLSPGYSVNFADGSAHTHFNPWFLSSLGRLQSDERLSNIGYNAYRDFVAQGLPLDAPRSDFFKFGRLFRDFPEDLSQERTVHPEDFFFEDLQVIVAHRTDKNGSIWDFAAKGGHNGEHHNHNDCGSYIFNLNGQPIVTEIGAPEYTKEFFGPHRYENIAARTLGHSLPIINGCEQSAGYLFTAQILNHALTPERVQMSVDLTASYSKEAHCLKFVRDFDLDAIAGILTVTDSYELSEAQSLEIAVITNQDVSYGKDETTIGTDTGSIVLRPIGSAQIDRVDVHSYHNHVGKPATINRIVLKPTTLSASGSVSYCFSVPEGK